MELFFDCLPCMLRQALEASRMVTEDEKQQEAVMQEAMQLLINHKNYRNSPELARSIHQIIKAQMNINDAYYKIKEEDLKAAKGMYPFLKKFLEQKENALYWALKIAATGNNIDSAIGPGIDLEQCLEEELYKEFAICDLEILKDKLKAAKSILFIGDNTGETIFDKVLIEHLEGVQIIYGVRSEPVINDVTANEAFESGLGEVSHIISTGCNAPGLILEECSEEFLNLYRKADIIISKGEGNYEALSEERGNIFFLLKAKCQVIAKKLNVNLNAYVMKYNQ